MQTWEYFRLKIDGVKSGWEFEYKGKKYSTKTHLDLVLNDLGQAGWELVSSAPFTTWGTNSGLTQPFGYVSFTNYYELIFKRPKT